MPALHLFGRRTLVGGDDIQIPALLTILMRLVQISLFLTPIAVQMILDMRKVGLRDYLFADACDDSHWFPLLLAEYMLASLLYCILSVLLEWRLVTASFQGTPTQPEKRHERVRLLLQVRLVPFLLLNASVLALGIAALSFTKRYYDCQRYWEDLDDETTTTDDAAVAELDDYYVQAGGGAEGGGGGDDDGPGDGDGDSDNERRGMILTWLRRVTVWWVCLTLLLLSQSSELMWSLASLVTLLRKERVTNGTARRARGGDDDDDENENEHGAEQQHGRRHAVTEEMWNDRCRLVWKYLSMATCFLFGGKELVETTPTASAGTSGPDYYGDIARALADYFEDGGVLDLVASDVAAGIIMLQRVQRQRLLVAREGLLREKQHSSRLVFVTGPSLTDHDYSEEGGNSHHGSFTSLDPEAARTHSPALSLTPYFATPTPTPTTSVDCGAFGDSLLPPPATKPEATSSHLFVTQDFTMTSAGGTVEVVHNDSAPKVSKPPRPYNTAMALTMRHRPGRSMDRADATAAEEEKRRRTTTSPPLLQQEDTDDNDDMRQLSLSFSQVSSSSVFYQPERRKVLVPTDAYDRAVLEEGARFARHALAIYTWVLYVYMQPLRAPVHLFLSSGVGGPRAALRVVLQALCGCITNDDSKKDDDDDDDKIPLEAPQPHQDSDNLGRRKKKRGSGVPLQGNVPDERLSLNYDSTATTMQPLGVSSDDGNSSNGQPNSRSSSPDVGGAGCGVAAGCSNLVGQLEGVDHPIIIGDNACQAHKTALLAHAGLEESDLIYVQLENGLQETPYCIVVDHKWRSVVLALRGSLSIEDCLVDVLINPISLEDMGRAYGFDGTGQYCHGGVVSRVRWIVGDLERHGRLDRVLTGKYSHYTLRIVGHSLGAGCGVLLSWMLRTRYPTLRCLSYSPPGGLLSWELATHCQDFCTSFVLDKEWVPRASLETMEHLRNEVLELIGRIKVPKARVAQTFVSHLSRKLLPCRGGKKKRRDKDSNNNNDNNNDLPPPPEHGGGGGDDTSQSLAESNAQLLYTKTEMPTDTDFGRQLSDFKRIQTQRKRLRGALRNVKLYPPGRIVHLVKTGERTSSAKWTHAAAKCITCGMTNWGAEYTPVWAEREDFNEILIAPTMATDHFPNRVCIEMERVARAFQLDTTLGSTTDDRRGAYREPTLQGPDNGGAVLPRRASDSALGASLVPASGTF